MYRKPNGQIGLSWTSFANNTAPSIMRNSSSDPGHICLPQKDLVFHHQTTLPTGPYGFDKNTIYASAILDNEKISSIIFKVLQKNGVLDVERGNMVDTTKIGAKFTHQLAEIPATRQKQIVDLLFWWEEECMRFRKLEGEKGELEGLVAAMDEGEQRVMFEALLERVKGKLRAKPSERVERVERDEDELMVRFRGWQGERGVGGRGDEVLPEYSRS